jgi:hypothetical protein
VNAPRWWQRPGDAERIAEHLARQADLQRQGLDPLRWVLLDDGQAVPVGLDTEGEGEQPPGVAR